MIVQLVSFKSSLREDSRVRHTADIINASTADLILFAGHTLSRDTDRLFLSDLIENKKVCAIIEAKNDGTCNANPMYNSLYILKHGEIKSMFTCQLITDSNGAYPDAIEHLILDLETRRKFTVAGRQVVILQCGEISILRNIQSEANRAEFRLKWDDGLCKRFNKILNNTDIILNPMHSPMGNQDKMSKRRELFSANNRTYLSTANFDGVDSINGKSLQYACINGIEQEPIKVEFGRRNTHIVRTFVI
jgi:hypothetical protein